MIEYRPGVVIWNVLPEPMRGLADAGRRVGLAVIDAMADLHRIDVAAHGLADLGRPQGFLARQLAGWRKRWALVRGEDEEDLVASLGERLQRRCRLLAGPLYSTTISRSITASSGQPTRTG